MQERYSRLQASEMRLARAEGLLTSTRELVSVRAEAAAQRLQAELQTRTRAEAEARDALGHVRRRVPLVSMLWF
jgi:hypothetical protein